MRPINNRHYDHFLRCFDEERILRQDEKSKWIGANLSRWWHHVSAETRFHPPTADRLPDTQIKRECLKIFCHQDSGYADWQCLAAVLAWGGQNHKNGALCFDHFEAEFQPVIAAMRQGQMTSTDAYETFDDLWKKRPAKGLGAAYFTKLIYFCVSTHDGYIMDQWAAKSINLLTGQDIVKLSSGWIDQCNTAANYEAYCAAVERLADDLDTTGEEIELTLFSRGGRQKWPWRQYVVDQDKAA